MIQQRMVQPQVVRGAHANLNLCAVEVSDQRAVQNSTSALCMMQTSKVRFANFN